MPKNKKQKAVFGTLMGIVMVYGMETYNQFLMASRPINDVFKMPIKELIILVIIVNVLEILIGGPLARKCAFRIIHPGKDREIFVILAVSTMTVCFMCPMMSLVATFLFKIEEGDIIATWVLTTIKNFPMAMGWQLVIAGPLVRFIFKKIFP